MIFQKNPLEEVICQLRFPTILAIGSEAPSSFQSQIRKKYPLYERDDATLPKEVVDLLGSLSPLRSMEEKINHRFITEDSERIISLAPDFVAISERRYRRWEDFFKELTTVQHAVEKIYEPAFYSRIGLRYRDVIDRDVIGIEGDAWADLLQPSLIGLLGVSNLNPQPFSIKTEATIEIQEVPGGRVTIRHGIVVRQPEGKPVYIIDADFYTEEKRRSEDVAGDLRVFNRISGDLFRWAITPKLHAALQPSPISSVR